MCNARPTGGVLHGANDEPPTLYCYRCSQVVVLGSVLAGELCLEHPRVKRPFTLRGPSVEIVDYQQNVDRCHEVVVVDVVLVNRIGGTHDALGCLLRAYGTQEVDDEQSIYWRYVLVSVDVEPPVALRIATLPVRQFEYVDSAGVSSLSILKRSRDRNHAVINGNRPAEFISLLRIWGGQLRTLSPSTRGIHKHIRRA